MQKYVLYNYLKYKILAEFELQLITQPQNVIVGINAVVGLASVGIGHVADAEHET